MQAASGLDAAESIWHLASVSSCIIWLRIFDGQRRLVVPEKYLVFAARINFAGIFEPVHFFAKRAIFENITGRKKDGSSWLTTVQQKYVCRN